MNPGLSRPRLWSYALMVLAMAVAARFDLGHALIAGLFSSMLLYQTEAALRQAGASPRFSRWSAVLLFALIGLLLGMIFVSFLKLLLARLPLLLDRALPRIDIIAAHLGLEVPADNVVELRRAILKAVEGNARSITATSGLLTKGFFQIVIAVVAATLHFLEEPGPAKAQTGGLDVDFFRECRSRVSLFAASFERVMSAQILIAAINAALSAAFLFSTHIPFRVMLTLTAFICGMIPIAGNVISNSLIVAAALTISHRLALAALVFLVVIHKAEYFLNSRIVGSRLETSAWMMLLGLLVGEALMGTTGVILAPTILFYAREELRAISAG